MTFERFDVHVVPFPSSDREKAKRRPALVVCDDDFASKTGNVLLVMITSAKHSAWPNDCAISDLESAGLSSPSIVRMRFSTLWVQQVGERIGRLSDTDIESAKSALNRAIVG